MINWNKYKPKENAKQKLKNRIQIIWLIQILKE